MVKMFADINHFDTDHKFDGESGESTEGPTDGKNKQQVTVVQTILYGCQRLNRQVCFIVKYYLHLKHKTERRLQMQTVRYSPVIHVHYAF